MRVGDMETVKSESTEVVQTIKACPGEGLLILETAPR